MRGISEVDKFDIVYFKERYLKKKYFLHQ